MKAGWQTISLGDLGRVFNGNSISEASKKANFAGRDDGLPYIATKDVGFDYVINYDSGVKIPNEKQGEFKLAPANTVLVCAEGGSAGRKIAHTSRPVFFGNKLFAISPNKPNSSRLVFYYCLSDGFAKQFRAAMAGLIGGVSINKFKELTIQLPPPAEQQRIVGILDEAFDSIATAKANAEKNLQNARALFESHLQSVFTQRGEGWVEKTVGELVAEGALVKPFDGNHGEIHPRKTDYVESGVPFIMACDLQNGDVDTETCKFITRKLADSLRVGFAKDGDVLVSHKGTIGRSAIVSTDLDYIMLTPQVTSYRVKDGSRLLNRFIRYYFMSPIFQREMIAGAADGSTRAYIGITKQLSLRFRFPLLAEQKRIVSKLDILDPETQRLESIYQQKVAALEVLKKSLLNQAFSGAL